MIGLLVIWRYGSTKAKRGDLFVSVIVLEDATNTLYSIVVFILLQVSSVMKRVGFMRLYVR